VIRPTQAHPAWGAHDALALDRAGSYTGFIMRSVADDLRDELRTRERARSPEERLKRALEAGRRNLELFAAHHGLSLQEARRVIERQRQRGRAPSSCIDALLR